MWKKILVILLFLICIGLGVWGTLHFRGKMNEKIAENEALQMQNMQLQGSLSAIGQMVSVYEVSTHVRSGAEIKAEDLMEVSIPASALGDKSVTDQTELVGRYYKVDINPGTILSKDMLMEDNTDNCRYFQDIQVSSFPVGTLVGDYVDVRIAYASGEEYIVLSHKRILDMNGEVLTIKLTEEERWCYASALTDASFAKGCVMFVSRYVQPGVDTDTVAYYPVTAEAEGLVLINDNISDKTRCINTTLRQHIDEVIFKLAMDNNANISSAFTSYYSNNNSAIIQATEKWKEKNTDEDGNFVVRDEDPLLTGNVPDGWNPEQNFNQEVGEAADQLGEDFDSLLGEQEDEEGID